MGCSTVEPPAVTLKGLKLELVGESSCVSISVPFSSFACRIQAVW
jgi:hypothetical protein